MHFSILELPARLLPVMITHCSAGSSLDLQPGPPVQSHLQHAVVFAATEWKFGRRPSFHRRRHLLSLAICIIRHYL
ncbi:hypothetical protein QF047_002365 [Arthrobacter sp. W4I7]|nr:hypothetical protein [Arthrobacter sp. W4I7]